MKDEEITYKDLSKDELLNLKDIYITSRVNRMSENDLRLFVRTIIEDQIKGTVGNEEEKEAWVEMKDFFHDEFIENIKRVRKDKGSQEDKLSLEEKEFVNRLNLLENREKSNETQDMW